MDKPLSQERLNYDELDKFLKVVESEPRSKQSDFFLGMCYELKRLQAIEAERDRYKAAFDYSVTNLAAYGLKQTSAQAMKMLEGVNDHE